jgi:OPT family oligopeptide transporter
MSNSTSTVPETEHLPVGVHAEGFEEVPPQPPPLAEDATPEQKDLHWFTHFYQGDRMPQLTFRAVAMGAVLGMLMSISNLYTTMKVGWGFGVAITACVMSFVIWNLFRLIGGHIVTRGVVALVWLASLGLLVWKFPAWRAGFETMKPGAGLWLALGAGGFVVVIATALLVLLWRALGPMSILENNCMQSTASAAGASTGATIATCFGAMLILDPDHHHQPWYVVGSFTLATAAMGVFLAIPMKRQMINQEQLPFPSGIAAATTLRSLHSRGAEAMRKAYSLVVALVFGAAVGVLNTGEGTFKALDSFFTRFPFLHLPDQVPEKGFRQYGGKSLVGFGFEPSVLLIAAGMIVGLRVSLSMLGAVLVSHLVIGPELIKLDLANANVPNYVVSIPVGGGGTLFAVPRWSLWGGTAIMVFASLMSLLLQWKTVARSFTMFKRGPASTDAEINARMAAIEVPTSWMIAGMVPITIAMLAVQVLAFHIAWWAGLIAVGMSFVLSMVACRATGETDTTPIGAMGKVMQILFAVLPGSRGNIIHNLASAGTAANSASSSADLLTDLKSGYLLGANPRKQFLAQFIGVFFGTLAIVPAWYLMIPDFKALDTYPLPATQTWVAVARVLSKGIESLPTSAVYSIFIGAFIGCLLPVLERLFPKARHWLPSAMGLGLGLVVFFSNALAFTIGALIAWLWKVMAPKNQERYNIPIASGLVAGESLMKALMAMLATIMGLMSSGAK